MPIEIDKLIGRLDHAQIERVGAWTFWRGTVDGYPVIVSKTLKGVSNAAAATVLAVERFHPAAIINQGTAGGHEPSLQLYDIVIGTRSVNIGAFRSRFRAAGSGSNSLDWVPLDLTATEGSASTAASQRTLARFEADEVLLAAARSVKTTYTRARVSEGVIGTSDVWNDEIDRIARFHSEFGTTVEEMETASAAQIARLLEVPFLGIRVVSDNITSSGAYDPKTSEACEDYVYDVVKAYVATLRSGRSSTGRSASASRQATTKLEIRLAETEPSRDLIESSLPDGHKVFLHSDAIATSSDISAASVVPADGTTAFNIAIRFSPDGAVKMAAATSAHRNKPLAIMVNGRVVAAPTLRSAIRDSALVTGNFTREEAEAIAAGLNVR